VLSTCVSALRQKVGQRTLQWINRLSGATIIVFGLGAFLSLVV